MTPLTRALQKLSLTEIQAIPRFLVSVRTKKWVEKPEIGYGVSYRRIIHYPEEYTIKPLDVTNLGGRDPVTGRLVVKGIGGGIKHKYHWVDWKREGPREGPPKVEKVVRIMKDGCRSAFIALVAFEDTLKYILATQNMKPGDLIRTSCHIPRIPVRPNEGDAYPLGALPVGTEVNCVEKYPGLGGFLVHAAGTCAKILRKTPDNHVIIQMPSKKEFALPETWSAQKNRELGNRPRSGWWQRKTGRLGRKLRKLPPVRKFEAGDTKGAEQIKLTLPGLP
ncbi:mRpL2 [Trypoxylus dichotomus]